MGKKKIEKDNRNQAKYDTLTSEEMYQSIIKEAPYIPGDDGSPVKLEEIPWIDPELIKQGQEFVKKHQFSIILAHISSLLYGFSFKSLSGVLMRTGGFGYGNEAKSMLRHVETGMHITKWYESDILDTINGSFKDIQIVRKLHAHALKISLKNPVILNDDVPKKQEKLAIIEAVKKDLECVDTSDSPVELFTYYPKVFFSQYDMLMTQFGFISTVFLFPKSLGIRDTSQLKGYLHMWAVIGRMLGIQDRFNLALHPDREVMLKLFNKLGMAHLKDMDLTILNLQQTYADSLTPFLKSMKLKSAYYNLLTCKEALPNATGRHLYAILTWSELISAHLTRITLLLYYHFDFVRNFVNKVIKGATTQHEREVMAMKNKIITGEGKIQELNKSSRFIIIDFGKRIWGLLHPLITLMIQRG